MRENLFVLAQAYANAEGVSLATVSKRIHGNQKFLAKYLVGDVSTTVKTYFVMVNKLRMLWPEGEPWPQTLPIPKLGKKVDKGFAEDR